MKSHPRFGTFPKPINFLFFALSFVLICSSSSVLAQQITSYDPPGSTDTEPAAMNDAGTVVGTFIDTRQHAYIRAFDGTITTVDAPGGVATTGTGINNAGSITGYYSVAGFSGLHGFIRDASGTFTVFDTQPGSGDTLASSINSSGQVVGIYNAASGFCRSHSTICPFVRDASGVITEFLPTTTAYSFFNVSGNDVGQTVGAFLDTAQPGAHGFIRGPKGAITQFDVPGATTESVYGTYPYQINNSGVIAGVFTDSALASHGFTRDANGHFTQIDYPGAVFTVATGVNLSGTVTGCYSGADDVSHGFARDKFGNFTSFDDQNAGTRLGTGTCALAINRSGQTMGRYVGEQYVVHGFFRRAK